MHLLPDAPLHAACEGLIGKATLPMLMRAEEEPAAGSKRKSKEGKEGKREKHKHKSKDRSKDSKREKRDSETPKAAEAAPAADAAQPQAADAPKAEPAPEPARERKRRWDTASRGGGAAAPSLHSLIACRPGPDS